MKITYEGTSQEIENYINRSCPRKADGRAMDCSIYGGSTDSVEYSDCADCWEQCNWIELIKTDEN